MIYAITLYTVELCTLTYGNCTYLRRRNLSSASLLSYLQLTTQYSQGDPKYVSHEAQSDAVAETVKQYVQTLSSDRRVRVHHDGDNLIGLRNGERGPS